ncbi:hypothetical protein [Streptomyces sp. NPDC048172]|uniref:hypothetical protein n=1 Tax=Streptomyces sp. NPDC048172 TaxID=3365505 RepID=UPI0037181D8E
MARKHSEDCDQNVTGVVINGATGPVHLGNGDLNISTTTINGEGMTVIEDAHGGTFCRSWDRR